jgi:hypothetical protein
MRTWKRLMGLCTLLIDSKHGPLFSQHVREKGRDARSTTDVTNKQTTRHIRALVKSPVVQLLKNLRTFHGTRTNKTNKLRGLSPRANYTDRATAVCRQSWCHFMRIEGVAWSAQRIPTAVFKLHYRDRNSRPLVLYPKPDESSPSNFCNIHFDITLQARRSRVRYPTRSSHFQCT